MPEQAGTWKAALVWVQNALHAAASPSPLRPSFAAWVRPLAVPAAPVPPGWRLGRTAVGQRCRMQRAVLAVAVTSEKHAADQSPDSWRLNPS